MSKGDGSPIRTFVAIDLPHDLRARLAALQRLLDPCGSVLKLVDPGSMHITVRFLGSLPPARVDAVTVAARQAAASVEPFQLHAGGVGTFPAGGALPRVIWVGLARNAGYERLQRLFSHLEDELDARSFPREARAFSPHLTLARLRDGFARREAGGLSEAVDELRRRLDTPHAFDVADLIVFRSDLSPRGPRYAPLAAAPLGAKAAHMSTGR